MGRTKSASGAAAPFRAQPWGTGGRKGQGSREEVLPGSTKWVRQGREVAKQPAACGAYGTNMRHVQTQTVITKQSRAM